MNAEATTGGENPFAQGSAKAQELSVGFEEQKKKVAAIVPVPQEEKKAGIVNAENANTIMQCYAYLATAQMKQVDIKGHVVIYAQRSQRKIGKGAPKEPSYLMPHMNAMNENEEVKEYYGVTHVCNLKRPNSPFDKPELSEGSNRYKYPTFILQIPMDDEDGMKTINDFMMKMNDKETDIYKNMTYKVEPTFKIGVVMTMKPDTNPLHPTSDIVMKDDLFYVLEKTVGDLKAMLSPDGLEYPLTKDIMVLNFGTNFNTFIQTIIQMFLIYKKNEKDDGLAGL